MTRDEFMATLDWKPLDLSEFYDEGKGRIVLSDDVDNDIRRVGRVFRLRVDSYVVPPYPNRYILTGDVTCFGGWGDDDGAAASTRNLVSMVPWGDVEAYADIWGTDEKV